MFIKTCKSIKNGKTYYHYQIAHSYRENGKVKHKLIANLGSLPQKDVESLIKGLKRLRDKPIALEEAKLQCKRILNFADIEVLDYIWKKLEISNIIKECSDKLENIKYNIIPYIKLMTFYRLLNPGSELRLTEWFTDIYFPELQLLEYHKLLRSLTYIMRIKNDIEKKLFEKQKDLFHLEVDLVFYDITSTYFESDGPAIAKKGYSRDKRNDRNQVIITLAITKEGFPIGHEVLEGNLSDKSTVQSTIDTLKQRFEIDKCIFVGDRGMVSQENIEYLNKVGYKYIFALRRRRLHETENIIDEDLSKYTNLVEYDIDGNEKYLKYLEVKEDNIRYFVCHNPERAEVDKDKLKKRILKINNRIERIIKHKGKADRCIKQFSGIQGISRFYNYGLDNDGKFYYTFKQDAYKYEKLIAGKYVLKTNEALLSAKEIIKAYKNLSRIEDSFRDIKDFLEVRPIFHKSQNNILGHIFISVLAYLLEKVLESYFHVEGKNRITARRIISHLSKIKLVVNKIDDKIFGVVTESTKSVKAILKRLGMNKFTKTYYLEKKKVKIPKTTERKLAKYDICSR